MGLSGGVGPGIPQPAWSSRITGQGPWDPVKKPISLDGCPAIPMPVQVAHEDELAPFFEHLQNGGTDNLDGIEDAVELDDGRGEPHYGVHGAEFRKGVVYEDGRMDLCKMVVGPDHIWKLMESLRYNKFVRHFLLGNNIIGPSGAAAIAKFIHELPGQIETWYIAGNCINGASFTPLVDALVTSPAVRQVWLKRNPLGPGAAHDLFRLITQTENLNTLDLDQTELGDAGVAELFTELAAYKGPDGFKLPLRNMYMNGCGISTKASQAIASFLSSPHCGLESLYMSCNPSATTARWLWPPHCPMHHASPDCPYNQSEPAPKVSLRCARPSPATKVSGPSTWARRSQPRTSARRTTTSRRAPCPPSPG
uniref:Uncharacterized protein n=1 Tax=Bionectria ochroleuca TaxID=29856 RepID=A0A8H7TRR0_BIOOC